MNDLPTAALSVGVLESVPLEGMAGSLALQAVLMAVNVGCYLTPAGSLAGIVFFYLVRRDALHYEMIVPRPLDLLWYGGLYFMFCIVMLCAVLPGAHVICSLFINGAVPAGITGRESFVSALRDVSLPGAGGVGGLPAYLPAWWQRFGGRVRGRMTASSFLDSRSRGGQQGDDCGRHGAVAALVVPEPTFVGQHVPF